MNIYKLDTMTMMKQARIDLKAAYLVSANEQD